MPCGKTKRSAQGAGNIRKRTVTKSNGKSYTYWEGRYSMGYDPLTGKQIQHTISGKTQKEVAQKLREVTAEIDQGSYARFQSARIYYHTCFQNASPFSKK